MGETSSEYSYGEKESVGLRTQVQAVLVTFSKKKTLPDKAKNGDKEIL
jgi:hypothetical protein